MRRRFSGKCKSKLMPRSDGPFEIIENIGPNAYQVDLLSEHGSATFNMADLSPYYEENEELLSLRSNSNEAKKDDGDHPTNQRESTRVKESKKI